MALDTSQAACHPGGRLEGVGATATVRAVRGATLHDATEPQPVEVRRTNAVIAEQVWKTYRLPHDRPSTFKQRVLHPRKSRASTKLHALRDVSFEVETGEFFGIIGRNGSGKSTMLKCLAGIYATDGGRISIGGAVSPFIELGVGFNPELTARDNVVVNAALLGMSKRDALARFPDIIGFAELEDFVDLKLKNYSSGMQVRLGFSSAIQAEADIYLVDEVLAVGDARFQEKCFDTFRQMKREARTVIYVTHDLTTVERFCDRAMLLERGGVVAIGDPREVIWTYRQVDLERERSGEARALEPAKRWGDGAAEVIDAWFEDARGSRARVLPQGERVIYRSLIRFNEPMENPIFGLIVKSERGEHVFVTNTLFDGVETGAYEPGEEALYSVALDALFADGAHTASPAIAHEDAQRFADWQEDAVSVIVRGERYSGGLVDLPHETEVERR
jgi:ABC-type polysaccharide/polyol phosphate transport system ATPase subunit